MCYYCHKLCYNLSAPPHKSINCRNPKNTFSRFNSSRQLTVPQGLNNNFCNICDTYIDMSTYCRQCKDLGKKSNHCWRHHK